MTTNSGCLDFVLLEINCLTHLKNIYIFMWLFYLTPKVKQTKNELHTHFVSSLTFFINPRTIYCSSSSLGVSSPLISATLSDLRMCH